MSEKEKEKEEKKEVAEPREEQSVCCYVPDPCGCYFVDPCCAPVLRSSCCC